MMRRTTGEEPMLTPREASERIGHTEQTLANWRSRDSKGAAGSGGPPWVKVKGQLGRPGGRVRYPQAALETWLRERQTPKIPPVHAQRLRAAGRSAA